MFKPVMRVLWGLTVWGACATSVCVDDLGCSLNGFCVKGKCQCVPEWRGQSCAQLNLQPARADKPNGLALHGASSWGGTILHDNGLGEYHLYASRIAGGCGLNAWFTNSEVVDAVSDDPRGPYTVRSVAIPHFAHEGSTYADPRPGHEGGLLMAHAGCGKALPAGFVTNCSGGVTYGPVSRFERAACDQFHNQLGESAGFNRNWSAVASHLLLANDSWPAPATNSNPGLCFARWNDSEPAAPNASLLVFKAGLQGSQPPCPNFLGIAEATSNTDLGQPWRVLTQAIKVIDQAHNHSEDPFLWRDERHNYHILYHSYGQGGVQNGVGGHAFAQHAEGPWFDSLEPAYTTELRYDNGSVIFLRRRERPQLLLSEGNWGRPMYLSNGVMPQNHSDRTVTLVLKIGPSRNHSSKHIEK